MPTQIIKTEYVGHPLNEIINSSLQDAIELNSTISEYALNVIGMSGSIYRRFVNNLNKRLTNVRYLEIGSWRGSTLCAAIDGVDNIYAVAIDNFTYDSSSYEEVTRNANAVKTSNSNVMIFDGDFNSFDYKTYAPFNVYLFDGPHEEHDHVNAITVVAPYLDDVSVIMIDDWNNHGEESFIKRCTYRGFEQAGLEVLYKVEAETGENPPPGTPNEWHNGCGIFVVRKKVLDETK